MRLISFTSDTSPFFSPHTMSLQFHSKLLGKKKKYEQLLVHMQALLCWGGSALKALIAGGWPAELHMGLISCAFPSDPLAAVPA